MIMTNKENLPTPCYVVEEAKIKKNLEILRGVMDCTGARILLAQKAFSTYALYPLIGEYLAGATASGIYEARLGYEEMVTPLKAGEKPGTTDIDLVADERFPFHVMGIFDNAGRYNTGSLRGGAMIYADSLFGHRDRLSIGSYFSGGAQSPFADYNFPINKKDGRIGFTFSSTFANVKWGPYADIFDIRSNAYCITLNR